MLEELKLYSEIEQLKRKLKLIENPLLRYVFGYQKNANIQAKGIRPNGQKVTHVVSSTMTTGLLQSLLRDKLCPEPCKEEIEIQVKGEFLAPGGFFFFRFTPGFPEFYKKFLGVSQSCFSVKWKAVRALPFCSISHLSTMH